MSTAGKLQLLPPRVRLRNGLYRVIEGNTNKLCRNQKGHVMDGGGHDDKEKAERQAQHIIGK